MKQAHFFISQALLLCLCASGIFAKSPMAYELPNTDIVLPISTITKIATIKFDGLACILTYKQTTLNIIKDSFVYYENGSESLFSYAPFQYGDEWYISREVLSSLGIPNTTTGKIMTIAKGKTAITIPLTKLFANITLKGDYPIYDLATSHIIGGIQGRQWFAEEYGNVDTEDHFKHPISYKVYTLNSFLGTLPEDRLPLAKAIGISCPWNASPRTPKLQQPQQQLYNQEMNTIAENHGIKNPHATIHQLLRADIDGDKADEVIICVSNSGLQDAPLYSGYSATSADLKTEISFGQHATGTQAGDFSFVAVRKLIAGQVQTFLLSGLFHPTNMKAPIVSYIDHEIAGLLDVDGDGQQEIIIYENSFNTIAVTIYKFANNNYWKVLISSNGE